ncbi:MAG: glycosyltransferase family 4 protein [Actinomycetota bacterium]|nr:glycosyltransferase family 4 protein [Actinomycetota bacterium]
MSKVLVISPDAVPGSGVLAAGPGIRYWQMARSLANDYGHDVTLAVPAADFVEDNEAPCRTVAWELDNIAGLAGGYDCVVMPHVHSGLSTTYRAAADPAIPTAVDLYDPVLIENIGLQPADAAGARSFAGYLAGVVPILKRGDYFFCANERQKYYYLGVLNTLGRINPLTYRERILEIVPFGVDHQPAAKTRTVMRGSLVAKDAKVILWFSGIYPWFDAYTLVEAMPRVIEAEPKAMLVILGGVHPRGHAPDGEFRRTKSRAQELGLADKHILFVDWQPYSDRADWYLESDLAVTTHKPSLETELSHRTRVVDFLWGGLPAITSAGDAVGEMLARRGCGETVPVGDPAALASTIVDILGDDDKRAGMSAAAKALASTELTWSVVIKPLADFCAAPRVAADRRDPALAAEILPAVDTFEEHARLLEKQPVQTQKAWAKAREVYKNEGISAVVGKSLRKIGRRAKPEKPNL